MFGPNAFQEKGFLVVPRLFDPALIDAVRDEFERQFPGCALADPPPHLEVAKRRLQLPVRLHGALLDPMLLAHPLMSRMMAALLGEGVLIDSIVCVTALPGAPGQPLHCDHPRLFLGPARDSTPDPPFAITLAIPLLDLTPETGTTRLHPGSHSLERDDVDAARSVLPYVQRGGCYLMDYRLWHQGTANLSSAARPILYIVYARPWFTDMVNFVAHERIAISREDAESLPLEHRTLLRRLAAKSTLDITVRDWLGGPGKHRAANRDRRDECSAT